VLQCMSGQTDRQTDRLASAFIIAELSVMILKLNWFSVQMSQPFHI